MPVLSRILVVLTCQLALIMMCVVPTAFAYEEEEDRPIAGYKSATGFFVQSPDGKNKLQIGGGIQARYTYRAVAGFGDSDGAGNGTDDESNLSIPMGQITLNGHLLSSKLNYRIKVDFGYGKLSLEECFVDYRVKKKVLHVRAGQWRLPPLRQNIMYSQDLSFVDRSHFGADFNVGLSPYDLGVALHNGYTQSPTFEYVVGFFSGTNRAMAFGQAMPVAEAGDATPAAARFKPLVVARIGYNYGGIDGYTEGDLKGGGFRFSLGAGTALALNYDQEGEGAFMANVDYLLKIKGFATGGVFYARMDQGPEGMTLSGMGAAFQASYLVAQRWQPAVRYELFMPQDDSGDVHVVTAGLGAHISKHRHVKWQLDASAVLNPSGNHDYWVRTQLQLMF